MSNPLIADGKCSLILVLCGTMTTIQGSAQKQEKSACRECDGLRLGMRSRQSPHEYLSLASQSEAAGTSVYRCLLCRSDIACKREGTDGRWWRWV